MRKQQRSAPFPNKNWKTLNFLKGNDSLDFLAKPKKMVKRPYLLKNQKSALNCSENDYLHIINLFIRYYNLN